jgi:hypothetical protein
MASGYKHLTCPGCDGTLEYVKEKKVWKCIYCGNEIRREEEYDGLYTIKNVAKQVLVDLANNRLDSAEKNLVECEKISSDYVGTLIAEICTKVFRLITPDACAPSEARGIMGQVKRLYEKFEEAGNSGISTEEEALYESFDGNSEALGVLVLVYDTLMAKVHLDFVLGLFDASNVYSKSLNANLLNYALKNNKTEIADKIFANSDNINCRDALFILLDVYEDSEEKRQYMIPMIKKAEFRPDDYKQMDTYIAESSDGADTKAVLYINAVERGQIPAMQNILRNVLNDENVSKDRISEIYDAFCKTKPKDAELYELIGEIFTRHSGEIANIEMQELISKDIYIKLSDKAVRAMLVRKELSVEDRIGLLEKAEKCKIDFKANDAIISEVLLRLEEPTDVRLLLIKKLDEYVDTVSTNTLTEYIVNVTIDKERKPEMLTELLKLNLNMSFFRDVLNQYMTKSNDSVETKKEVSQLLGEHGLGVDGQVLLDMACSANENDYLEKAEFIRKSVQNGSRINAEFLSTYLERMSPENYHSEIASILSTPASLISDKALANYVFNSGDEYPVKLQNAIVFAEKNGKNFGDSLCEIMHLGSKIQCNLFQGYVLAADDSAVMAEAITGAMKNANAKLNPAIRVNGESVKFKKYINDNKSDLSPITLQLCEANNVFSIFF